MEIKWKKPCTKRKTFNPLGKWKGFSWQGRLVRRAHARSGARSCKWHTLLSGKSNERNHWRNKFYCNPLGKWKGFPWQRKVTRARSAARSGARSRARSCKWHTLLSGNRMKGTTKGTNFNPLGQRKRIPLTGKGCSGALGCALGRALGCALVQMAYSAEWTIEWKEPLKEQTFNPLGKRKRVLVTGKG